MKTKFLLLCITLFSISAQDLSYGVIGALNISDVIINAGVSKGDFDASVSDGFYQRTQNFAIGGFVNIPFTKEFSFQPELHYSVKGYEMRSKPRIMGTNVLNYLELPLLVKYELNEHFSFLAGPYASYLLDSETDVDYIGYNDNREYKGASNN